jgi:hypothetical protein
MYATILLAAALQDWERYSAHAVAAREVAATLALTCANAQTTGAPRCCCGCGMAARPTTRYTKRDDFVHVPTLEESLCYASPLHGLRSSHPRRD